MLQFSICVLHFNGSTKFELIFFKLQFSKWSIQEIPSFCSRYTRLVNSIHSNHSLRKEIWTPIYYSFPIYCTFPVCMHISFGNFFDFQLCIEDKKQMSVFSFVQMETTGVIESTHQNKSCGYDKHLMSMLFLCIPIFFGVIHEKFQKSRKNYRFFFWKVLNLLESWKVCAYWDLRSIWAWTVLINGMKDTRDATQANCLLPISASEWELLPNIERSDAIRLKRRFIHSRQKPHCHERFKRPHACLAPVRKPR